jgi:hypothetical protein
MKQKIRNHLTIALSNLEDIYNTDNILTKQEAKELKRIHKELENFFKYSSVTSLFKG